MFQQLHISYEKLRAMGRGGSQENLNLGLVGDFRVLVPPISVQERYSGYVRKIEHLKLLHVSHLAALDALYASLQYRAFRGELWDGQAA